MARETPAEKTAKAAAKTEATAKANPADQPAQVTLASPYGYLDDDEKMHFWQVGTVVNDPAEITDLIIRLAPLVEFPESC